MPPVGASILVVDDDPDILDVLADRLEALDYRVVTASTGRDGLARLEDTGPQLVLLDMALPDMNGLDVLTAMRTHQYSVEGVSRSYLDFNFGFGYSLSVFLLLQAIVLWQLCAIAKSNPALVRPIVGSFAVASLVGGIITWMFIFPLPALFSAVLSACLVIAFFAAR